MASRPTTTALVAVGDVGDLELFATGVEDPVDLFVQVVTLVDAVVTRHIDGQRHLALEGRSLESLLDPLIEASE